MRPLNHSKPLAVEFDIRNSEVVKWLIQQPEVLSALFSYYSNKKAIIFDSDLRLWKGSNYAEVSKVSK